MHYVLFLLACNVDLDTGARVPDSGVRYDVDGDGFFASDECDDNNPLSFPGGTEVCDGEDNDCDGAVDDDPTDPTTFYEDADHDGFGGAVAEIGCLQPKGAVLVAGDCDDAVPAVNPDATETCGDGIDDDCDGSDMPCK
jgi:hypothetical protein